MPGKSHGTHLTIASRLGADDEAAADWVAPLCAHWVESSSGSGLDSGPIVHACGFGALCDELSSIDPCEPGHRAGASRVVVVLAGDDSDENDLYRLLDALRRSMTPAVVLATEASMSRVASCLSGDMGLSLLPADTTPEAVTRALRTLLDRQPLLDAMSREVRLSQLSQRSIAGELDKLHKELHEAAHMQQQFVQKAVPYIPELNIGVIYRPATYVSGDLFDVDRLDEHHVSVFLADAVGHGVPAAMLTLFISRALPKMDGVGGNARIVPPGEALARLNREFCGRPGPGGRFATAVYAVIDTRTMTAQIAGAGHPAAIVSDGDTGRFDRVESEGPLLGVFPDGEFESTTVQLGATRRLALFTDGFETAFPDAEAGASKLKLPTDAYIDRLARLAANAGDRSAFSVSLSEFEAELDAQMGSLHRPDDVTALIVAADAAAVRARLSDAA